MTIGAAYPIIPSQAVPAAGTYTSAVIDVRQDQQEPLSVSAEAQLAYTSGGTTIDIYVQTSLDGGLSWADVINFHFATASDKKFAAVNRQTAVVPVSVTDGTLAANTKNDGIVGPLWRTKTVIVGPYVGTFRCDIMGEG